MVLEPLPQGRTRGRDLLQMSLLHLDGILWSWFWRRRFSSEGRVFWGLFLGLRLRDNPRGAGGLLRSVRLRSD